MDISFRRDCPAPCHRRGHKADREEAEQKGEAGERGKTQERAASGIGIL